jgi:deoxyribodipyrimidine photo-lyase
MSTCLFWFRRDLRLFDNAGLFAALNSGMKVQPIFIFDKNILDELKDKTDLRVNFIHRELCAMDKELAKYGAKMHVIYGTPEQAVPELCAMYQTNQVFTNHDYEPYAKMRDEQMAIQLSAKGGALNTFKDQVIFERTEVVKDDGKPYTVFTPYSKKWKAKITADSYKSYDCNKYFNNFNKNNSAPEIPSLASMGFTENTNHLPSNTADKSIIFNYHNTRDIPSMQGTTRLSIHLRFGTVSVRQLAKLASETNEKYLNELIWREFYQQILWHFPHVVGNSFKPQYDAIQWRKDDEAFEKWCTGNTGYAIVDAGMRELTATGWMHNRVRMIVASFLTKHLLIDWRLGEAYFAEKLIDFELASNNGGWQWASGSGVDAAPYFRIFNPYTQTEKFDNKLEYIKKWVPEFEELTYRPIVDHKLARERCLKVYKQALGSAAE